MTKLYEKKYSNILVHSINKFNFSVYGKFYQKNDKIHK